MGLRSYFTLVNNYSELTDLINTIPKIETAYGINYVLKLNKDFKPFKYGDVLVAWSSDGSSSVYELENTYRQNTIILERVHKIFRINPEAVGKIIDCEDITEELFLSTKRIGWNFCRFFSEFKGTS